MSILLRSSKYKHESAAMALSTYNLPDMEQNNTRLIAAFRYLLDTHTTGYIGQRYPYPSMEDIRDRIISVVQRRQLTSKEKYMLVDIFYSYFGGIDHDIFQTAQFLNLDVDGVQQHHREMEQQRQYQRQAAGMQHRFRVSKTIYEDTQNVHNSQLNKQSKAVGKYLIETYGGFSENIIDAAGVDADILEEILLDTSVFMEEYTIADLFCAVYKFILLFDVRNYPGLYHVDKNHIDEENDSIRKELFKRLREEMRGARGKCSTGFFNRFVNVFRGFTDDPNLEALISNEDRARSAICNQIDIAISECKDDRVADGLLDKNETYIRFIQQFVTANLSKWCIEYEISKQEINLIIYRRYQIKI